MKKLKLILRWYCMLSKRLLVKRSFIMLLCLIPIAVPLMSNSMDDANGVLKIMLCCEDDDEMSLKIIDTLLESDSILDYSVCKSKDDAVAAVKAHNADTAWIFNDNLSERAEKFFKNKNNDPLVQIIESESNIPLRLSREILFGALYQHMSYYMYEDYTYKKVIPDGELSDVHLLEYYDSIQRGGDIIESVKLNPSTPTPQNHLTAPLRGILSLLIVLCTMAAALYFMQDGRDGKYAWLHPSRRIIPAFAMCLSAAVLSAAAVLFALYFAGIFVSFYTELLSMLMFVFAATGFVLAFSGFFKSPGKFGAVIPSVLIIMLVLSPIFVNLKVLKPVRMILPTHYYLNTHYNSSYFLYTAIYCAVIYTVAYFINYAANKKNT